MDNEAKLKIEERIIDMLKTVYDPEIPVNVYDLGLIYKIDLQDDGELTIDMTLTAPNCPAAEFIMEDVRQKVESVDGVKAAQVNLVFEPVQPSVIELPIKTTLFSFFDGFGNAAFSLAKRAEFAKSLSCANVSPTEKLRQTTANMIHWLILFSFMFIF